MDKILAQEKRRTRTIRGYVLAFILLLISYFITLYSNRQLIKQSEMVVHSYGIINNMEQLFSEVKDAETGVRGYLISRDLNFLSPYYGSKEKADSLCRVLLISTADNPSQQERLIRVKNYINQRYDIFNFNIQEFNNHNKILTDSMRNLQPLQIKVMTDIRMAANMTVREENILLTKRDIELKKTRSTLNTITFISLCLALALVAFGIITFIYESKERKKGLLRIQDYQLKLQKQIDELNTANKKLIEMRSMEKFASTGRIARTIAHEVRNPLTNISLAINQVRTELLPNNEEASFLFDMMNRNSERINQLISELLNSTKFSELNFGSISINELLDEALLEAKDRILLNNITVEKKYSSDICNVKIDKEKIKIALLNLIINAVEAMENSPSRVLTVVTKGENDKCKIEITDTGNGMDEDALSRLFEPYFTSKLKGNGLGLTNTQNIILNHKGNISAVSKKEKGTTFTIELDFA